jgi:phosphatidylglycerophosphatase A
LIDWKKAKDSKTRLAVFIGTAGGAGLLPWAPGTWGTIVGIPISYYSSQWDCGYRIALWSALFLSGTWAAKTLDQNMGSSDNQSIVMDEVVGYGITAWTAGQEWKSLLAAFVLFRIFDVWKLPPVRQVDRWSKKKASEPGQASSAWWGGFGVMADDLLASFQGLFLMWLAQTFKILP